MNATSTVGARPRPDMALHGGNPPSDGAVPQSHDYGECTSVDGIRSRVRPIRRVWAGRLAEVAWIPSVGRQGVFPITIQWIITTGRFGRIAASRSSRRGRIPTEHPLHDDSTTAPRPSASAKIGSASGPEARMRPRPGDPDPRRDHEIPRDHEIRGDQAFRRPVTTAGRGHPVPGPRPESGPTP